MRTYRLLSITLILLILISSSRPVFSGVEVIETYNGFAISWKGEKGEKAVVELPAFCLELEKDLPTEETSYAMKEAKLSEELQRILNVYRFLKDNVQLRYEFLRRQKDYAYVLERAELASELQWSNKAKEKLASKPSLLKRYEQYINLTRDLLSQKAIWTATQHAIWAQNSGISYEDALEKIFERQGDVSPPARDLMTLFYRLIAPYTQLILEASGSSARWMKQGNEDLLIDPFDPLHDELFLGQKYEEAIEKTKKILNSESPIKEKLKAQILLVYSFLKIDDIQHAKQSLANVLAYIEAQQAEKIIEFQQQIQEMEVIKAYLEGRIAFEGLYEQCLASLAKSDFETARTSLEQALNYLPDHHEANYLMALIYYNLGDMDRAVSKWKKVKNIAPYYSQWHIQSNLALLACYKEVGKEKEMQNEFQELQELLKR